MVKRVNSHVTMQKVIPQADKKYRHKKRISTQHLTWLIKCDI